MKDEKPFAIRYLESLCDDTIDYLNASSCAEGMEFVEEIQAVVGHWESKGYKANFIVEYLAIALIKTCEKYQDEESIVPFLRSEELLMRARTVADIKGCDKIANERDPPNSIDLCKKDGYWEVKGR